MKTEKFRPFDAANYIRDPADAAEYLRLAMEDCNPVEIIDALRVISRARVTLDDLLAQFDPEKHRHEPLLDDAPVGRETL